MRVAQCVQFAVGKPGRTGSGNGALNLYWRPEPDVTRNQQLATETLLHLTMANRVMVGVAYSKINSHGDLKGYHNN